MSKLNWNRRKETNRNIGNYPPISVNTHRTLDSETRLWFGKYSGKIIKDIATSEQGNQYIKWLLSNSTFKFTERYINLIDNSPKGLSRSTNS